jgi:uncharacterized phage protein gp47/JayE
MCGGIENRNQVIFRKGQRAAGDETSIAPSCVWENVSVCIIKVKANNSNVTAGGRLQLSAPKWQMQPTAVARLIIICSEAVRF